MDAVDLRGPVRPRPRVSRRGAGQLLPRARHRARERGGLTTASTSRPAIPSRSGRCGSGCSRSPSTPIGSRRISTGSTGRTARTRRRRIGSASRSAPTSCSRSSDCRATKRSRCSRRGPTRCSAVPGSCSRPSTRWSTRSPRDAQKAAVAAYRAQVEKRSERDRLTEAADAPKTGVATGAFATNPVNGKQIPIWIADYVLASYGTGAVFACPAHDERDHAFAKKFGLPDRRGRQTPGRCTDVQDAAYLGDGPHVSSRVPRRARHRGRQDEGHRVADRARPRCGVDPLQVARLAVLTPALLGRAVPALRAGRRHRQEGAARGPAGRAAARRRVQADRRRSAAAGARWRRLARRSPTRRPARRARARPTRCRSGRGRAGTTCGSCHPIATTSRGMPRRRSTGCRSTSTSAATSTRCCTSCTRGSGTRCCSMPAWCRPRSRSSACSTRA